MDRREFLRRTPIAGASVLAVTAGAGLLAGCSGPTYASSREEAGRILVARTELEGKPFVVVRNPRGEAPILVHPAPNGGFEAVLLLCTHQGCRLNPTGRRLLCPCHGSEFTPAGEVVEGPAVQSLTKYPVTEEAGYLVVLPT